MIVYRVHRRGQPQVGPYAVPINPMAFLLGASGDGDLKNMLTAADIAQVEASMEGVAGPYQMPPIIEDVDDVDKLQDWAKAHRDGWKEALPEFGFASIEQYREWFSTPGIRHALYTKVSFEHTIGPVDERNDFELHRYEIADDLVYVAHHQVVFPVSQATDLGVVPYEEAVK